MNAIAVLFGSTAVALVLFAAYQVVETFQAVAGALAL